MTNQEIYTKAKNHLLKQLDRAVNIVDGTCAYRASNGLKCAVGALIPDELYDESFEFTKASDLLRGPMGEEDIPALDMSKLRKLREMFQGANFDLIDDLQLIHDEYVTDQWAEALSDTAKRYGLEP